MYNYFQDIIRLLKTSKPAAYPVTVRRQPLTDLDGYCQRNGNRFKIVVNKHLDEPRAVECLLHEYAHALSWSHLHDTLEGVDFARKIHDATWGVAYAEVYCVYEKYITGQTY